MDVIETGTCDHRLSNPRWRQHRCGVMGWQFVEKHLFALHDLEQGVADPDHIHFCMEDSHRQAQRWLTTNLGRGVQQHAQAAE